MRELRERAPGHQLRDQVNGVLVLPQLVEGDDAGVVQTGCDARLADGALGHGPVALPLDDLHRDLTLELLVEGQPDHAEPARAEPSLEAVAVEHEPVTVAARCPETAPGIRLHRRRPAVVEPRRAQLLGGGRTFHVGSCVRAERMAPSLPRWAGRADHARPECDTSAP